MKGMIGPLSSAWNLPPASPLPPNRVWRDWVLIGVLPALAILEGLLRPTLPDLIPGVILTIALMPTLLWRRARPLLMFGIGFVATELFGLVTGQDLQLYSSGYILLLVYAVFRWGSGRALLVGGAMMLVANLASVLRGPFELPNLIGGILILLLTASLGLLIRVRAGSRMRELERTKSHEREELARDLHDTVAHHLSAIAIQAQAGLATVGTNPDAATAALRLIETEASRTLTEMRSMVRALRRDGVAERAPAPTVSDVRELARSDSSGPAIDVALTGPFDALPAPIAVAVYRIVQESVTNSRQHARKATRIEVRVDVDDEKARLTVTDDGAPGPAGTHGYGIVGMTERAALLGGTCTAGRSPKGGWLVTAELPSAGAST